MSFLSLLLFEGELLLIPLFLLSPLLLHTLVKLLLVEMQLMDQILGFDLLDLELSLRFRFDLRLRLWMWQELLL